MSSCLGDVVAALVDGELDHASRERAQRHLAHCTSCRGEVDAQRRVKSRLGLVGEPGPSDGLTARLIGLAPPGTDVSGSVAPRLQERAVRPVTVRSAPGPRVQTSRPVSRPSGRSTTGLVGDARRAGRRLQRRAGVGSALVVVGLAAVLALGGPSEGASTPVDPGSDAFVTEFVSTTGGSPIVERGGAGSPR